MKSVYFDESGNTGQDLLNHQDPMFVLSSCCFNQEDQDHLLRHFSRFRSDELKSSRLRRTESGRQAILSFLEDPVVNTSNATAYLVHKPFMVVTKFCDLVVEPSMKQAGVNFYERGLNIATANFLAMTMPTFLNPETWKSFQEKFVRAVRERTPQAFRDLTQLAELVHGHLQYSQPEMAAWFAPLLILDPQKFLPLLGKDELDPIVPAYYLLADGWGKKLGAQFEIVADHSTVLIRERERLLALANPAILPVRQGFDRRQMDFPLKVANIISVDSKSEVQVQLADIIAGALMGSLKSESRSKQETFEHRVLKLCFDKGIVIGGLWPTRELDPERLDTDELPKPGQFDLPTYTGMLLTKYPPAIK